MSYFITIDRKIVKSLILSLVISLGIILFSPSLSASTTDNLDIEVIDSFVEIVDAFSDPRGVTIDPASHNILVSDTRNDRIQVFDPRGSFLFQFGRFGVGPGEFVNPEAIAIDPISRNIIVADTRNDRIQVFNPTGNFLFQFGSYGFDPGEFANPVAMAIDPISRNIVVAELGLSRIEVFNSEGNFLFQFGSPLVTEPGDFIYPNGMAVDPITQNIIVTDFLDHRIVVFDLRGNFLFQFGSFCNLFLGDGCNTEAPGAVEVGDGQFEAPGGIYIAPEGNIFVADLVNGRVQIFNRFGVFLSKFGSIGGVGGNPELEPGRFNGPRDIVVPGSGEIIVADSGNNRVQIFNSSGNFLFLFDGVDYGQINPEK